MFIWAELVSQGGEAMGTDLWGEQKRDLRLRGKLGVLAGMLVGQEDRKPNMGRFYGQSPGQLLSHDLFVDINGRQIVS